MGDSVIIGGKHHAVGRHVRTWHETGLHFGGRSKRRDTRYVVLHWTGGSGLAPQVFRTLVNARNAYHIVVDPDGTATQFMDLDRIGTHAQGANLASIGISLVNPANQLPSTAGVRREQLREVIHGKERVYSAFTVAQVLTALRLCEVITAAYGLPWAVPMRDGDVLPTSMSTKELESWRGICGHLQADPVRRAKWDPGLALLRAVVAHPLRSSREVLV